MSLHVETQPSVGDIVPPRPPLPAHPPFLLQMRVGVQTASGVDYDTDFDDPRTIMALPPEVAKGNSLTIVVQQRVEMQRIPYAPIVPLTHQVLP